jgi:hypothetical protein
MYLFQIFLKSSNSNAAVYIEVYVQFYVRLVRELSGPEMFSAAARSTYFLYLNIGRWRPYCVHSALRPLLAYCTCPA